MHAEIKIGIIGFDTSHVTAFTRLLNDPTDPMHVPGAKVVAGFPSASEDIQSSISRRDGFVREMREQFGVETVDSIEELLTGVEAILLESVDGRRHLAEATPVIKARKPLFIDKPLAANYAHASAIVRLAQEHDCPLFSSSSLRFDANISAARQDPRLGQVMACDAFTSAFLEPTNPGLFWYGIHGVEILYSFMGTGCLSVQCHHTENYDFVVGHWPDSRIGTVRGTRCGAGDFGATIYGTDAVTQVTYSREVPFYRQLLREVVPFLAGSPSPVPLSETLEIMAFMQAAYSSQTHGEEVPLASVRK